LDAAGGDALYPGNGAFAGGYLMAKAHEHLRHASVVGLCILPLLFLAAVKARAETVAEIAALSGPDRSQRLVEGAKKEGGLTLYSSLAPSEIAVILSGFEKKYGLKVNVWKGDAGDILQRAVTESHASRTDVDVIETAGPNMEAMQRENLLQEVSSPTLADLIAGAIPPHREWVVSRMSVINAAYNINLISKAQAPTSYDDLLDPKWKGKLGIEAFDSAVWLMGVADMRGEKNTIDLFRKIVAVNGVSLRRGHFAIANFVVSGDVPFALTVYRNNAALAADAGAPIQTVVLPPLLALPSGIAVARRAPHPYSAVLFWDYFLTEGQKVLAAEENVPSNRAVQQPPPGLTFINSAKLLDDGDKWQKLFHDIFFVGQSP
jgi:iron(III) transport system substrate-binding protein